MGSAQAAGANFAKGIDWGGIVDNAMTAAKGAVPQAFPAASLAYMATKPAAAFGVGAITGDPGASATVPTGTAQTGQVTVALPAAAAAGPTDPIAGLKTVREMAGAPAAAAAAQAPQGAPGISDFHQTLANYAAQNGGGMSLREYAALAHAAGETSPLHMQVRNMAQNDEMAKISKQQDELLEQAKTASSAKKANGDPTWATDLDAAVKARAASGIALIHGVDPMKEVLANQINGNANTPQPVG